MPISIRAARATWFAPSLAAAAALVPAVSAVAATIYFADIFNPDFDAGSIRKVQSDGTGLQTVLPTGGGLRALDLDAAAGKIYWVDVNNFVIRRANLDGSDQEDLVTAGLAFPSAIALDVADGKMYWGDQSDKSSGVYRANLDGSEFELITSTAFHRGIAIDHAGGKVYWSTSITENKGDIRRANLDGTGQQIVVSSLDAQFKPAVIALDLAGGKIYWTDFVVDMVRRANLDGSSIQTLFIAPINHNTRGIALDLAAGKVYWGQDLDVLTNESQIMRMNLDGSSPQTVIRGLGLANYLALLTPVVMPCPADLDHNGMVNGIDLALMLGQWSGSAMYVNCPPPLPADLNGDCRINGLDLAILLGQWGPCP